MSETFGYIGLGNMGAPMARRLIDAGHRLVVHDLNAAAAERFVALGAEAAGSPREVADRTETVFVSLPTPPVVEAVATGAGGVIEGGRVRRFVDLSTTGPTVAERVAAALAARDIVHVDCPVSGGPPGAERGTLAVMVSGAPADFEYLKPVVSALGKVFYIGAEPGLAQTMKLVNNLLSATALAATSEAIVMGVKAGLDPAIMVDVLNVGSGRNSATQDKFPRSILTGGYDYGFTTGLMYKDLRLCMSEADVLDVPMPIAGVVRDMWQLAHRRLGDGSDFTQIIQMLEDWAGVDVLAARKGG